MSRGFFLFARAYDLRSLLHFWEHLYHFFVGHTTLGLGEVRGRSRFPTTKLDDAGLVPNQEVGQGCQMLRASEKDTFYLPITLLLYIF